MTQQFPPWLAAGLVIAILAAVNVIDVRVPHATLVAGPVCAAGLPAIGRLAGLDWADMGLGRGTWRPGLKWAGAEIGLAAVVLAAGAALPLTRNAFRDSRYHLDLGGALLTSLVRPFRSGVHHVPSLAAERTAALADLSRGDTVVLFTDGLIERRGRSLDDGVAALLAAAADLAGREAGTVADRLLHELVAEGTDDDVALLAIHFRG